MVQLVINITLYRLALEEVACDWSVQRSCDPLSFLSHTVALYMVSNKSVPFPV